jgi:hypothetical protein
MKGMDLVLVIETRQDLRLSDDVAVAVIVIWIDDKMIVMMNTRSLLYTFTSVFNATLFTISP